MAKDATSGSRERAVQVVAPTEISDADLIARAKEGDRWAEELLFRRYVRAVGATALRLLGDKDEADDVVQDTFALAFEQLPQLREAIAFKTWLLRIAVSRVHRVFRRQRLQRLVGMGGDERSAQLAAPSATPEARTELALLDRELRRLPAAERIAWMLRYVEGLELVEVAEACDCSLATAKRRIAAAHARVERHLRSFEHV